LAFEIPQQPYSGKIGETVLGTGPRALSVGGEDSYPFHLFEGSIPNPPKIAMEIWDYDPSEEWPAAAVEPFKDVISSPEAWAQKCVTDYGADAIVLQLKSTDPNAMDRSAAEAAEVTKRVADAIDVPLVVWGTANNQKDEEVLKKIAEVCQGGNIALGPVEEGNHKGIGASALGYKHVIVASSPIDVNLAKQLNILLGNLGVASENIIIDPTTGGLGYGLEYSYSVMERIRMAALTQEDDKLQVPIINNIGNEIWKSKEAGQALEEAPTLGDPERRAILMEATAAVVYLMGGSDILILRHPETVRLIRSFVDLLVTGGSADDVQPVAKRLAAQEPDLLALAPEPNLEFKVDAAAPKKEPASPKEKKAAPKRKPKAEPASEAQKKVIELKPKDETQAREAAQAKAEKAAKAKAEAEETAKIKAEAEAQRKAEEEARKEAGEQARAEEAAKAKVETEAQRKAEEAARAEVKEKEELLALREKRAAERKKTRPQKVPPKAAATPKAAPKAAAGQERLGPDELVDRLTNMLERIHRHA
jgi:acetyl-CoA decarbonylase/synthase complex subunit delta